MLLEIIALGGGALVAAGVAFGASRRARQVTTSALTIGDISQPLATFGASEHEPVVSLSRLIEDDGSNFIRDDEALSRPSPVLSVLASSLPVLELASGQYVKVSVAVSKLAQADGGKLYGFVRNANGRVQQSSYRSSSQR